MRRPANLVEFLAGDYSPPTGREPVVRTPEWVPRLRRPPPRLLPRPALPSDASAGVVFGPGAVTGEPRAPWDVPPMAATPLTDLVANSPTLGIQQAPSLQALPDALLARDAAPWRSPTTGEEGHQAFEPPSAPNATPADDLDAAWNAALARVRARPERDPTGRRAGRDRALALPRAEAAAGRAWLALTDPLVRK